MKTLFTLDLKNYGENCKRFRRDSARAIIHVEKDKLALVYAVKLGYYKFPGGGIHEGEDKIAALSREVQEEVGLKVIAQSVKEYGVAHRFQKSAKEADTVFVQDSFYYECDVERVKGKLKILKQNMILIIVRIRLMFIKVGQRVQIWYILIKVLQLNYLVMIFQRI